MKKILVIDDDLSIRQSLSELLQLLHYETIEATNGLDGIKAAEREAPDLILCDIAMPDVDGYTVLMSLSKNEKTAVIPFIFLTAKTEIEDLRKGMELGADDYLFKPFTMDDLIHSIELRFKKQEQLLKSAGAASGPAESGNQQLTLDSHIMVMAGTQTLPLKVSSIIYIRAQEHYSDIFSTTNKKTMIRKTMKEWERILPSGQFFRVHRSTIINIAHVVKFEKWFQNTMRVHLKDVPEPFEVSRRYGSILKRKMKIG